MIIIAAIPGGLIGGIGFLILFAWIYFTGKTYALDRLNEAELVKEIHPSLSQSLRFLGRLYLSVCYVFMASLIFAAFTSVFLMAVSLLESAL